MKKLLGKWKSIKYTPLQLGIMGLCLILCMLFIIGDNPFTWSVKGQHCSFEFVEAGDYTLSISCVPSETENIVVVLAEGTINEGGQPGLLLASEVLEPGQTFLDISLSLQREVYDLKIYTSLDPVPVSEEEIWSESGLDVESSDAGESLAYAATLRSCSILYRDGAFLGGLCLLVLLAIAYIFARVPRERYLMPMMAVVIGLLAGIPLYVEFAVGGHDFNFHMNRLEGIYRAMASGHFPVRMNAAQISGYGYLSSVMYPQLFFYPFAMLRFLDVSLITCWKLLLASVNIGTALVSYYALKNISGSKAAGILMSFLYTFSAYRLVCMYVRVSLGEALSMLFLPLLLWGVYECLWGQRRWIILTLGMTGVLGSHIISVEICAVFVIMELILWACSRRKDNVKKRVLSGAKALVTAVLLNLSFLIPFLYYYKEDLICFHQGGNIANTGVYFSQMFSMFISTDGVSLPRGDTRHEMALTVGAALLLGGIIFVIWAAQAAREDEKAQRIGIRCMGYAILALLLSSWLMPWGAIVEKIPYMDKLVSAIQFVWRFLGPGSLFLCVCGAIGLAKIWERNREWNWAIGIVAGICLITSWSLFDDLKNYKDCYLNQMEVSALDDVDNLYLYADSYGLEYTRDQAAPYTWNGTEVSVSRYVKNGTQLLLDITADKDPEDYLVLPLYYYPGYEIKVNGVKVNVYRKDTLVACELPDGQAHIEARYVGLPIFKVGDIVSVLTALGLCGCAWKNRYQKKVR